MNVDHKRQLETLISNLPGVVYRCRNDEHYTTEFVSDGSEALTGYPAQDFLEHRREISELIHPADRDQTWSEVQSAIAAGQPYVLTYRILDAAGKEKWVWDRGRGVFDERGELVCLEGFVTDISELRRMELALKESEYKYRELVEHAADGIVVYDQQRRFVFANQRALELLGDEHGMLLGSDIVSTYAPADLDVQLGLQAERMAAASRGEVLRYERRMRRRDGSTFPAEIRLKQLSNGHFQAIFDDITERHLHQRRILRLTSLHRARSGISAACARIGERDRLLRRICRIAVTDGGFSLAWIGLLDEADGTLRRVAQASSASVAPAPAALQPDAEGVKLSGICETALRERRPVVEAIREASPDETIVSSLALESGQQSAIALPLVINDRPVGVFALYAADQGSFDEEETQLLAGLAEDVSLGFDYRSQGERVRFLSNFDPLTGLANRDFFFRQLALEMQAGADSCRSGALVLVDLDRFRVINDTLGHAAADTLILEVVQRIRQHTGEPGLAARVGADSFAIVLRTGEAAADVARQVESYVHTLFDRPFHVAGQELRISATAGVAVYPQDADTPATLLANAEAAQRDAARQRDSLGFYQTDLNAKSAESLRLESGLRRALKQGELVMWYQPKLDARTGEITGLEALMRWQDPERGLIAPGLFIPTMEQTGMIAEAGRWALQEVARDCERWHQAGLRPPRIAVNVSVPQLKHESFLDTVVAAARRIQDTGSMLDLEITESAIVENFEAIVSTLRTICGLGSEIAIDDFGTGYSSLAYIARLPIHALKIDQSFVAAMEEKNGSLTIVRSVISLAHALKLQVVAEGVETQDQARSLVTMGCDQLQGYLFSRPMPHAAVGEFLRDWRRPAVNPPSKHRAPAR